MTRAVAPLLLLALSCRPEPNTFFGKFFKCDQALRTPQCGTDQQGKPMTCFSARQLGAQDFCSATCDGDVDASSSSATACLESGVQLTRCSPAGDPAVAACPTPELGCYRTDLLNDEGVCTTFDACSSNQDCKGTVRQTCLSHIFQLIYPRATHLRLTNLHCVQDNCSQQGSSCQSDEICLPNLVPESSVPIDVCAPKCDSHLNCPPSMFCYQKVSGPASPVCLAGILAFKCSTSNDCIMGNCIDVGTGFNLCSIPCSTDDECAEFNGKRGSFMCLEPTPGAGKHCIASESFNGAPCAEDKHCHSGEICSFYSPYTATTNVGSCLVPCDGGGQCPARGGVPHTCLPLEAPLQPVCYPGNAGLPCTQDGACLPGMSCMTARQLTRDDVYVERPICTRACSSNADCGADRLHGSLNGWCDQGFCVLARRGDTLCASDEQCASGSCGPSVRAAEIGTGIQRCTPAPGDPATVIAPAAVVVAATLCLAPPSPPVQKQDKVAVLLLGVTPADAEVADNLTEVVIARIAQRQNLRVGGKVEFRRRLGIDSDPETRRCLDDAACIGTAAVALGVTWIVSGTVSGGPGEFMFSLALRDMRTGNVERRALRSVNGSIAGSVAGVRAATDALFVPPPAPPASLRLEVETAPGRQPDLRLTEARAPVRRSWPAFAAYGSGGAALVALGAGLILGTMAQIDSMAQVRIDAQRDYEHRRNIGLAADAIFAGAALLGAVSAYLFIRYRHEIFMH